MASWYAGDAPWKHDRFSMAIFSSLREALFRFEGQQIEIAAIETPDRDGHDFRNVIVALTLPGMVPMTLDCWSDPEGEGACDAANGFDENVSEVVEIVSDFLGSCRYHGFQNIARLFAEMRQDARLLSAPSWEAAILRLSYSE